LKNKENLGILSGCRHFFREMLLKDCGKDQEIIRGYVGGQLLVVTRSFYLKSDVFQTTSEKILGNDNVFIDACRNSGFKIYVSNPGYCQHIGVTSDVFGNDRQYFINGKINLARIDPALYPPYVL
jgi:hypothetical protein